MEAPTKAVDRATKAVTPTVKFETAEKGRSPGVPPPSTKPSAGYMGGLLGAVNKDGRPNKCNFGTSCSYQHVSPVGKSDRKIIQYAQLYPNYATLILKFYSTATEDAKIWEQQIRDRKRLQNQPKKQQNFVEDPIRLISGKWS